MTDQIFELYEKAHNPVTGKDYPVRQANPTRTKPVKSLKRG